MLEVFTNLLNALKAKLEHAGYRVQGRRRNFAKVYKQGGFSGREFPSSGAGSTLEQTRRIREAIPKLLKELMAESLIDAPCGDFTWMAEIDLGDVSYVGVDIVEEVIRQNMNSYARENRSFIVADIVKNELPRADIVLCRDCFVHLSNRDIVRAIKKLKASQSTYLLTTTFLGMKENGDLVSGRGWRPINLNMPPFNFPPPLRLIVEECTELDGEYNDKGLGLWKLVDIAA